MKYFYNDPSGMVPNIGEFTNGDEITADVADKLKLAGYNVREEVEPTKFEGETL